MVFAVDSRPVDTANVSRGREPSCGKIFGPKGGDGMARRITPMETGRAFSPPGGGGRLAEVAMATVNKWTDRLTD